MCHKRARGLPLEKYPIKCEHCQPMNNTEPVENKVAALITSFIEQEIGRIDLRKELVQMFNSELALRDKQLIEEVNNIPRVTMKIKNLKTKDYDDLDVIPVKDALSLLKGGEYEK